MQPYSKSLKTLSQNNRQKPLLNYIVDFYCPKVKLSIELDGSQHYEPDYQENDRLRDAELNSLGFTVMRFSNVYFEIEAVVEQIYLFLENVKKTSGGDL